MYDTRACGTYILLLPDTHTLVISDSNLRTLVESDVPRGWQVEVISGAKLHHVMDQVLSHGWSGQR